MVRALVSFLRKKATGSPKDQRDRKWRIRLLFFALGVFCLFLPGRASIPPFDRDEPRYMEATAQMLGSGNFVDVRFQDKPRYLQPAGIYWLESVAVSAAGKQNFWQVWPYRIPSLLAIVASAVLTARIGALLFGRAAGLTAAALLVTSVLVTAEGRMATIDSVLLLMVMLVQSLLLRVLLDRNANRETSLLTALGWWAALGCGLMLKGPVILIPGFGTILGLWIAERDRSWWKRLRPAWGWLVMLLVVLPWCVAIDVVSHGEFFSRAVGRNFLGKIGHGQEAHGLPPGYHILVFLLTFWPGSLFAVMSVPAIFAARKNFAVRFLLCWIIPHWLVFELIATKLPHYVMPVWPAVALLTGFILVRAWHGEDIRPKSRTARVLIGLYGALWALLGLALICAGVVLSWVLEHHVPLSAWIATAGSLPLLFIVLREIIKGRVWQGAMGAMGMAIIIYAGLFLSVIPGLHSIWLAPRLAQLVDEYRPCPQTQVISTSFSEPSLVFMMHGDVQLKGVPDAVAAMKKNRSCTLVLIDRRSEDEFRKGLAGSDVSLVEFGRVKGVNYSNGKHLDIGLYGDSGN
jgi:4-amino-4-deoxy-L-arabinose transferase-like glycosyltransferase